MLRPTVYALLTATLATPLLAQSPHPRGPDDFGRFPRVDGRNLEGERFTLPADFGGQVNVVLVAFKRCEPSESSRQSTSAVPTLVG